MKRSIYILILLAVLFSYGNISCKEGDVIITPNPIEAMFDFLLSQQWTIVLQDGTTFTFTFGDWFGSEKTADADYPLGTDMTPDELRQYFAVKIVNDAFPSDGFLWELVRCYVYEHACIYESYPDELLGCYGIKGLFDSWSDTEVERFMKVVEATEDVPNGPPPPPPC